SILVDALALLAGGRGSSELIREGAERLTVSGEFDGDAAVRAVLAQAGLPESDPVLLRRELAPDGRGRAFVEDEPAAVRTLARIGEALLAIHGQNAELEVVAAAARWSEARERLEALEGSRREREARLEMLEFQIREIDAVAPVDGDELELPAERDRLLHADRIRHFGE